MKKLILILLVLLFFIGCTTYDYNYSDSKIQELDKKYGGDFKNEMLNATMMEFDNLSLMRDDLVNIREDLVNRGINKIKSAILLIDVRLSMLESQKFWYLMKNLGSEGVTQEGFSCSELPKLLLARQYANESLVYAQKANNNMDSLLIYYPDSRLKFGVDKEKIQFYYSPLNYLSAVVDLNTIAIEKVCGYKSG